MAGLVRRTPGSGVKSTRIPKLIAHRMGRCAAARRFRTHRQVWFGTTMPEPKPEMNRRRTDRHGNDILRAAHRLIAERAYALRRRRSRPQSRGRLLAPRQAALVGLSDDALRGVGYGHQAGAAKKGTRSSPHNGLTTLYAHCVPTLTNLQKRTDRIYKLTQALVEMRPSRRRGDVGAVKRMTRELEILRAAQAQSRTTKA